MPTEKDGLSWSSFACIVNVIAVWLWETFASYLLRCWSSILYRSIATCEKNLLATKERLCAWLANVASTNTKSPRDVFSLELQSRTRCVVFTELALPKVICQQPSSTLQFDLPLQIPSSWWLLTNENWAGPKSTRWWCAYQNMPRWRNDSAVVRRVLYGWRGNPWVHSKNVAHWRHSDRGQKSNVYQTLLNDRLIVHGVWWYIDIKFLVFKTRLLKSKV